MQLMKKTHLFYFKMFIILVAWPNLTSQIGALIIHETLSGRQWFDVVLDLIIVGFCLWSVRSMVIGASRAENQELTSAV